MSGVAEMCGGVTVGLSQQPMWPHSMHMRRWTDWPPMRRQSSQPSLFGVTSATWSRWLQVSAMSSVAVVGELVEHPVERRRQRVDLAIGQQVEEVPLHCFGVRRRGGFDGPPTLRG
jgi:hypothetical protein